VRQSLASKDVEHGGEESTVLEAITRQCVVKTQQTEKACCGVVTCVQL
jgi:hypothetical protein